MNTFAITAVSLILSIGLVGCQKVKTSQYYAQHTDEMNAMLEECKNESQKGNKIEGNLAENCKNARAALRLVIANNIHQSQ